MAADPIDPAIAPIAAAALPSSPPPPRAGAIGSLGAFWPLLEPVLAALAPRALCEVGVESGAFAGQLLDWCQAHGCQYFGIDPAKIDDEAFHWKLAAAGGRLIQSHSLETLRTLEPCGAYFLDGDHNFYTVRHELAAIAERARELPAVAGPIVFVHDVGWPWGRRDMYYAPDSIPAEFRHEYSEILGTVSDRDALVDGGLRAPGRYAIATTARGERNGVLTAVEAFVADARADGSGWEMLLLPVAFGLAVLHRPAAVSPGCRQQLETLRNAAGTFHKFLETLEASYQEIYLFSEAIQTAYQQAQAHAERSQAHAERSQAHAASAQTHAAAIEKSYRELRDAYASLLAHSDGLLKEYHLLDAHAKGLAAANAELRAAASDAAPGE